jgi:hypothetical protein
VEFGGDAFSLKALVKRCSGEILLAAGPMHHRLKIFADTPRIQRQVEFLASEVPSELL